MVSRLFALFTALITAGLSHMLAARGVDWIELPALIVALFLIVSAALPKRWAGLEIRRAVFIIQTLVALGSALFNILVHRNLGAACVLIAVSALGVAGALIVADEVKKRRQRQRYAAYFRN
ncbi:hypothetical protein KY084_05320 [Stakelama sp. CBK3Z-3]|uniref:Holin n=1 Tax=Stakelama flava TaxID=2860338 RepID=A0ABS6XJG7_9SPHN|nr:hypothetical protein [Stakelama flava]MBW4330291.1 hypothetical protein [Stakelama flava]